MIATDDIATTHEHAARNARPPLLVVEPLREYLDALDLGTGDLDVEPLGEGRSNVTYLLRRDGLAAVLRRPPRPPLPPKAHDMAREARLLRALEPTAARTARLIALCEDETVIGAPFLLMELIDGRAVTSDVPEPLDTPAERRRMAEELVDALVELHAVDPATPGLGRVNHAAGYLERQLDLFARSWEHNRTRVLPPIDRVGRWLAERRPSSGAPTLVHGDYRLGNVLYAATAPARLVAVLDWELATLGDPLADLGYLCALWAEPDDPPLRMLELSAATRRPGFPTRAGLVERYVARSGRMVAHLRWYEVLALWKAAIYMEGNYRRAIGGMTDDSFLRSFGTGVVELARRAEALTSG